MRVRDQRPTIVDQRSISPPDATRRPSNNKERPNVCDGLRSTLTSQVSAKSETAAPTTSAPLLRSDFSIFGEQSIAVGRVIQITPDKSCQFNRSMQHHPMR